MGSIFINDVPYGSGPIIAAAPTAVIDDQVKHVGWRQTAFGVDAYKPLYEKSFKLPDMVNSSVSATPVQVGHNIANVEFIVCVGGYAYSPGTGTTSTLGYASASVSEGQFNGSSMMYASPTVLVLQYLGNYTGCYPVLTVQWTTITDIAIPKAQIPTGPGGGSSAMVSGTWTPQLLAGAATLSAVTDATFEKIGKQVAVFFKGSILTTSTTDTTGIILGNFPYTVRPGDAHPFAFLGNYNMRISTSAIPIVIGRSSAAYCRFYTRTSTSTAQISASTSIGSESTYFQLIYYTDD